MTNKPFLTIENSITRLKEEKRIDFSGLEDDYVYNILRKKSLNKVYTPYKKVLDLKKGTDEKHIYEDVHFNDFEICMI